MVVSYGQGSYWQDPAIVKDFRSDLTDFEFVAYPRNVAKLSYDTPVELINNGDFEIDSAGEIYPQSALSSWPVYEDNGGTYWIEQDGDKHLKINNDDSTNDLGGYNQSIAFTWDESLDYNISGKIRMNVDGYNGVQRTYLLLWIKGYGGYGGNAIGSLGRYIIHITEDYTFTDAVYWPGHDCFEDMSPYATNSWSSEDTGWRSFNFDFDDRINDFYMFNLDTVEGRANITNIDVMIYLQTDGSQNTDGYWDDISFVSTDVESSYTLIDHDPIEITGDAEFITLADSEGWQGDGSMQNPIIISNLRINNVNSTLINITDVTKHFRIISCQLTGGGREGVQGGIHFNNVNNGQVIDNTVSNNSYGIKLLDSLNNLIANNSAYNNQLGMSLIQSLNNTIANNNVSNNNYCGINLVFSGTNTITNNTISNNHHGIFLQDSSNIFITNNNANNNIHCGIEMWYSNNNLIADNNASNNSDGINLMGSANNIIFNNTVSNNHNYGISLENSANNSISSNNFAGNSLAQAYDNGNGNSIANQFYYNYYDDWTGPDANGDSIVDLPYPITGSKNNEDPFPVINPYNTVVSIPTTNSSTTDSSTTDSSTTTTTLTRQIFFSSPGFTFITLLMIFTVTLIIKRKRDHL
ncbi:MAG: right-handed parallel beta-helix repeat-containing protein [Candidatus Hodarchaeales archaeon]|jgi:parallel beta-helix repeat protein